MATARVRFTAQDRRHQILEVASQLFARQGFNGTTTRHIAQASRVNEALIFRHFPSKEDLYWAVIEEKCKVATWQEDLQARLASGKSDREIFQGIAADILDRRRKDSSLSRLLLFSALESHTLSERFFRTQVARYFELLAGYIAGRIREGGFREVDPMLAARGFLGMINNYFQVQELFGGKRHQQYDDAEATAVLTDLWLNGMVVSGSSGNNGGIHRKRVGK
ncbi:MAG TPA: TetR/AcrR family transcriptional regulator [Terriglobales bacterium]|nr:TetR/AcrR family transcriptional regulator [Terriglobales bacterium]